MSPRLQLALLAWFVALLGVATIVMLVMMLSLAHAQSVSTCDPSHCAFIAVAPTCVETFPELPALAKRLGVKANVASSEMHTYLGMCDGRQYDLFALINAALDKLDKPSAVKP